jgi:hypothetical protein
MHLKAALSPWRLQPFAQIRDLIGIEIHVDLGQREPSVLAAPFPARF